MRDVLVYVDNYMLGHADAIAEAARPRGLDVVAVGRRGAAGGLRKVAERVELAKLDAPSLRACLADLDRRCRVRALRCAFGIAEEGELLAGVVADVRAERGLAGPSRNALELANNKYLTRRALAEAGLERIRFALVASADEAYDFAAASVGPVLLKPLTGVGASLIVRCDGPAAAARRLEEFLERLPSAYHAPLHVAAYDSRSRFGRHRFDPQRSALIEEHVSGPELSVECLCVGAEVYPLVLHDKLMIEEASWTVREHMLVAPSQRLAPAQARALKRFAADCVRALDLSDTLCHVELRLREDGEPVVLEINPRIGAGCIRDSLQTFWGCDPYEAEVALALGEVPRLRSFERTDRPHAMIFLFSDRNGRLERIGGLERVLRQPGVIAVRTMAAEGEAIGGELEECFLAGVWRRLQAGQSAEQAYAATVAAADIRIAS